MSLNVDNILSDYNVFITGASGFVGIMVLQRLLNVQNAENCKTFCLLRCGRKYSNVTERLRNEILNNSILELSCDEINNIIVNERILAMEGDLSETLLGLDHKMMARLKHSHDVNHKKGIAMIHCAADIDFERELNESININVNGTYNAICVASEIDAKSFIHISTLYVNSREHRDQVVQEAMYDSGLDFVALFKKWKEENNSFDSAYIAKIKSVTSPSNPLQRTEWPNTYTFTKNMAENIVLFYCKKYDIATSIIRLGIVSPIHRGKHLGWFMGNGGFVFLVIGIATGNIRYLNGDGKGRPDFVPVDYTVDVILSVTAKTIHSSDTMTIYQCGVIANDPLWNVTKCVRYARPRFLEKNLPYVKPNADITFIQSTNLFTAIELILYEIPLFVLSILSYALSVCSIYHWIRLFYDLAGYEYDTDIMHDHRAAKKGTLTMDQQIRSLKLILYHKPYHFVKRSNFLKKARQKLRWFNSNYTYFVNQRWHFDHTNVKKLYELLDHKSRQKYEFDVNKINFNKYACDSALVCFNKYIQYRNNKKQLQIQME
eukprot:479725_1